MMMKHHVKADELVPGELYICTAFGSYSDKKTNHFVVLDVDFDIQMGAVKHNLNQVPLESALIYLDTVTVSRGEDNEPKEWCLFNYKGFEIAYEKDMVFQLYLNEISLT